MSNGLLKELGIEGIAELIAERFDDAVDLMHPNAVVYGGAIRDILAGMPLEGDLDIATDGYSHKDTCRNFRQSSKWTEQGRRWHPTMPTTKRSSSSSPSSPPSLKKEAFSKSYAGSGAPIVGTTSFITYKSAKAQIVMAEGHSKDSFDSALEIVKHVDFVCCGLAMDNAARVFEVIEGAYEDCKNRVLRLNKAAKKVDIGNLKERIAKLKKRGWESKINVSAVKRKMERAHKARASEQKRQMEAQQEHTIASVKGANISSPVDAIKVCAYLTTKETSTGPFRNFDILFNRGKYDELLAGTSGCGLIESAHIIDAVCTVARNVGIGTSYKASPGGIKISIRDKRVTSKKVHQYTAELQNALERLARGHGSKPLKKEIKKKHKKPLYNSAAKSANLSGPDLGTKLHKETSTQHEAMAVLKHEDELVHSASHSDVAEVMSFKATMASDGQILISPTGVEEPYSPNGDVTIDVSALTPNAAQQLRQTLENAQPEDIAAMTTPEPEDIAAMATPEEVPAQQYRAYTQVEPGLDIDVREVGQSADRDIAFSKEIEDVSFGALEMGEDGDERDRGR